MQIACYIIGTVYVYVLIRLIIFLAKGMKTLKGDKDSIIGFTSSTIFIGAFVVNAIYILFAMKTEQLWFPALLSIFLGGAGLADLGFRGYEKAKKINRMLYSYSFLIIGIALWIMTTRYRGL